MIELSASGEDLVFRFPDVHPEASLDIQFKRTLRIPDDGNDYRLPPGFDHFPMRLVDDFATAAPKEWVASGGVMLPMYQAEAMWIYFNTADVDNRGRYPFAIKIATGKVNAVSGQLLRKGLNMEPQDYAVAPNQPWIDGYCVKKGVIRQFVAMPLGQGYSVEEQVTGKGEFGGLQILVYPMKRKAFEKRFPKRVPKLVMRSKRAWDNVCDSAPCSIPAGAKLWDAGPRYVQHSMGLSPGGKMRQEIYDDPYDPEDWDLENYSHCFVHIANSEMWTDITGKKPPYPPLAAADYSRRGLPWFDYYAEEGAVVIEGAEKLEGLKSVKEIGVLKNENPLPENESVEKMQVQAIGKGSKIVREGDLKSPKPESVLEKKVKTGYTHITVILDRSGSMESICDDTIGGMNAFVKQQKSGAGEATLTLVQFDSGDPYEVIHHFLPIGEVPPLTQETYIPQGGTPLLDALGRGINDIEGSIAQLPEEGRPEKVIVAVITDGEENDSKEFSKVQVEKMIKSKTSEAGWEFIFLSADLGAIEEAQHLGFQSHSSIAFYKSSEGVAYCMDSLSERVSESRSGVVSGGLLKLKKRDTKDSEP